MCPGGNQSVVCDSHTLLDMQTHAWVLFENWAIHNILDYIPILGEQIGFHKPLNKLILCQSFLCKFRACEKVPNWQASKTEVFCLKEWCRTGSSLASFPHTVLPPGLILEMQELAKLHV